MGTVIAFLLVLGTLTGCARPDATSLKNDPAGAASTLPAPAAEFAYQVELETHEETVLAEDGTELVHYVFSLPVLTVYRGDGTEVTEAVTPAEEERLAAAEAFNGEFRSWSQGAEAGELADWAAEDFALHLEGGIPWTVPYELEFTCEIYQTERIISVEALYYSFTGGVHPNTVLLSWNFDLESGVFFVPEVLAEEAPAFSEAVAREIARQSQRRAEEAGLRPEEFFWENYQEIIATWSSYAVSFDETGMTVGFSPYELAAYAAGSQVFYLTYDQLAPYLSSHGRELLGLEAAEESDT